MRATNRTTARHRAWLVVTALTGAVAAQDPAPAARAITVTLRATATLPGLDVRVGDLADVASVEPALARRIAELAVAERPAVGFARTFERADLEAALLTAGVPREAFGVDGAHRTVAHAAVRELSGDEIRAVADPILVALSVAEPGIDTEFELQRPLEAVRVPPGRVDVQLRGRGQPERRAATRASVAVDILVDGSVWRTVQVDYRLRRYAEATTVVRPIQRGETVAADDLEAIRVELGSRDGHHFPPADDLAGQVATRQLAAGRPLRSGDVAAPAVVQRDDEVRLVSQRGRIRIAIRAIALEAGAVGDRIQVRNVAGGTPVQALVRGPGLVIVPGTDGELR